jgi:hypothetical protein
MTRRRERSRGQAMAEFALIAPVFFLLLFAIIEGGRFIFYYEMLNNATREGARYAIIHGGNSLIGPRSGPASPSTGTDDPTGLLVMNAARTAVTGLVAPGGLNTYLPAWWDCADPPPGPGDPSTAAGTNERGKCVSVFLSYTYSPIIPVVPPITINAESTLVVNN